MDIMTLMLFGGIVVALVVGGFFALIALALLIYVVSHAYPWLQKIAVWCAKPENLFAFLVLAIVLIFLIVLLYILVRNILILLLILPPLLLFLPVYLGILVWIIRGVRWLYLRWRDWLVGIYTSIRLEIVKAKIKMDVQKETDWKVKWSDMKSKLSEDADQARRKISGRKK